MSRLGDMNRRAPIIPMMIIIVISMLCLCGAMELRERECAEKGGRIVSTGYDVRAAACVDDEGRIIE